MWSEFRAFLARGSAFDLAVGIIIGAGGVDLEELYINLSGETFASRAEAQAAGAATIDYGLFIGNVISFLLVAFAVFLLIRATPGAGEWRPKLLPRRARRTAPFVDLSFQSRQAAVAFAPLSWTRPPSRLYEF